MTGCAKRIDHRKHKLKIDKDTPCKQEKRGKLQRRAKRPFWWRFHKLVETGYHAEKSTRCYPLPEIDWESGKSLKKESRSESFADNPLSVLGTHNGVSPNPNGQITHPHQGRRGKDSLSHKSRCLLLYKDAFWLIRKECGWPSTMRTANGEADPGVSIAATKRTGRYFQQAHPIVIITDNPSQSDTNNEADTKLLIAGLRMAAPNGCVLVEILKKSISISANGDIYGDRRARIYVDDPLSSNHKQGPLLWYKKVIGPTNYAARAKEIQNFEMVSLSRRSFLQPWLDASVYSGRTMLLRGGFMRVQRMTQDTNCGVARALRSGYYWPTMHRDARDMIKKCNDCQVHRPIPRQPQQELTPITSPWPFYKWGIDIAGPFPVAAGGLKFLIVAIDYFTKWIEAKAVATITGNQALARSAETSKPYREEKAKFKNEWDTMTLKFEESHLDQETSCIALTTQSTRKTQESWDQSGKDPTRLQKHLEKEHKDA
ncbi:reverse transcriptase domain-containing protein [Tanacetum coccineum]